MTSHEHSGENTDVVKFLSCEICDKIFNRQATLIRHTQTVHGPMINCVHPQCNYSAPQSRTNQLQQHMARVHDLHYYKSGSIGVSREEEMSDPRMSEEDKERICFTLRDSVLNLCKENYNSAIEVDGLICISVLNSKEQHVVKIHDLLTEKGQLFTSVNTLSNPKTSTKQRRARADLISNKTDSQVHPMLVVPSSGSQSNNLNAPKQHSSSSSSRKQIPSHVTPENSVRFPFLVQTLQENHRNRASSASPTLSSVNPIPQHRESLYGNMAPSPPVMDSERPASSLLKILSSHKQKQAQQSEQESIEQVEQSNFNDTGELMMSVKEEPVDEEMTDQIATSHDVGDNFEEQANEKSTPINVKNEPVWNEADYGGTTGTSNNDFGGCTDKNKKESMNEVTCSQNQATQISSNSILAKILNGKEETYTTNRKAAVTSAPKTKTEPKAPQQTTEKSDDPDSSLLYRLPFATFQDLFPSGPSGDMQMSQHSDVSQSSSEGRGQSKQSKSSGVQFDTIVRKMLEEKSSTVGKRQPPRKKKKTVVYDESADFSSPEEDLDSLDEKSDKEDDVYTPSGKELMADIDETEFTMSLRRKPPKRKIKKRSVAVKSTTKAAKMTDQTMSTVTQPSDVQDLDMDQSQYRYACYHCQLRFSDRQDRDQHEEENCINELIICDVCKGYFANTTSRNKHLFEIHSVLPDEQKDEIQERREGAMDEFKTIAQNPYEFETLKDCERNENSGLTIESVASISQPHFDMEASSSDTPMVTGLVTKFIVPYCVQNEKNFIKCPLCISVFSDSKTKDEHLRWRHKIANQIDNGDGTVSLQMIEKKPSKTPPVYVTFETNQNN
ncbi:unnamed protein product [Mytilus coruscus]|uniref:C2H2-type domain-containing protein n=1 Tax=Mytilus coruscus TaxID=42192 RepID=A0A6J8C498_MYTCO|nr:unnamed protein product [Mytilus coruscus]